VRGNVVFKKFAGRALQVAGGLLLLVAPLLGQGKRLWVLRAPGEMVEYDPATFAVKQTVKVPAEAVENPLGLSVNHQGQILFVPIVSLPGSRRASAIRSAASAPCSTTPKPAWLANGVQTI